MTSGLLGFLTLFCLACGTTQPTGSDAGPDGQQPDGMTTGCPADPEVVTVDKGCLKGASVGGVHTFLGVPFSAPPTGDLRWKPPADVAPWMGVRDATAYSKACPQIALLVNGTTLDWNEDCLYLNVWSSSLTGKLPVMVWFHGGGLVNGSGIEPIYSGNYLAKSGGVIAVNVNYRLAQLGYLGHPAMSAEQGGKSGDYGLRDQIAALKWVQANIAKFGGDPGNVTIFGESAGALSVCALLASPRAKGLFHRAIAESGGCVPYGTYARPLKTTMSVEGRKSKACASRTRSAARRATSSRACDRSRPTWC